MLENSTISPRYGYAANVGAVWEYLPPCFHCLYNMRNDPRFISKDSKCDKCVDWNVKSQSPLMSYASPNKYPSDMVCHGQNIRPQKRD